MSAIYLYRNQDINALRAVMVSFSVFIRHKDYLINEDGSHLALKLKGPASQTIYPPDDYIVLMDNVDSLETIAARRVWGYDYIIHCKVTDERCVSTSVENDPVAIRAAELLGCSITVEAMPDLIFNNPEGETYDTKYVSIGVPENEIEFFRQCLKSLTHSIPQKSIYDRWYHDGSHWFRTKPKDLILKELSKVKSSDLNNLPTGYYSGSNIVSFKMEDGTIKRSFFDTLGRVIDMCRNRPTTIIDSDIYKSIYIPKGCRYAVSGWVYHDNRWHFYDTNYYSYSGDVEIDGDIYPVFKGILYSDLEFALDEDGVLHKVD